MVHPLTEHAGTVWDPYCSKQISCIKKVQRSAALPVLNKHRNCWWHAPPVEMAVLSMLMMKHLAGWPCFTRYSLDKYVRCPNLKPKEGKEKAPQLHYQFLLLHWQWKQHILSLHNQRMEWAPSKLPWHLHIEDIIIPTVNNSTSLPHPLFFCSLFFFSAAQIIENDSKGYNTDWRSLTEDEKSWNWGYLHCFSFNTWCQHPFSLQFHNLPPLSKCCYTPTVCWSSIFWSTLMTSKTEWPPYPDSLQMTPSCTTWSSACKNL